MFPLIITFHAIRRPLHPSSDGVEYGGRLSRGSDIRARSDARLVDFYLHFDYNAFTLSSMYEKPGFILHKYRPCSFEDVNTILR